MASSYNELFGLGSHSAPASLKGWWPLIDDAASTAVVDYSGNGHNGVLSGGANTEDIATTGPTSWLPTALALDGTDDAVVIADHADFDITGPLTVLARADHSGSAMTQNEGIVAKYLGAGNQRSYALYRSTGGMPGFAASSAGTGATASADTFTTSMGTAWASLAAVYDQSTYQFYRDGASDGSHGTVPASLHSGSAALWLGCQFEFTAQFFFAGTLSECAVIADDWPSGDIAQWADGPELINAVAPVVSGTETNGATLSCTTGTWALDTPLNGGTNGTPTYSYQWTRSTDGSGTGEADIVGATSATYVPIAVDIGKYLRCRVRASNTGGFDPAADTYSNFTGQIAPASPQIGIPSIISTPSDGTYAWNNEANLTNDGLSSAETDTADEGDDLSFSVLATGFNLAIPDGATFEGLRITLVGMHSNGGVNASNNVALIRPIIGGVAAGDDKGDAYQLSGTPEDKTYGGPTDKWGLGDLTHTQLNASDTGIRIQWEVNDGDSIVLDTVRYEVFYSEGGGPAEETVTHTVDGLLKSTAAVSHAADGLLLTEFERSHTADALIVAADQAAAHSVDALLIAAATASHTADGLLIAIDQALPHATDALLVAVDQAALHTVDAQLVITSEQSHTADALLIATDRAAAHATDALLQLADQAVQHTADGFLAVSSTDVAHTADALVQAAGVAVQQTTDALLAVFTVMVHGTDAWLMALDQSRSHTADGFLAELGSINHSSDAAIKAFDLAATHTTDAHLVTLVGTTHTTDAALKALDTLHQHGTDALLKALDQLRSHAVDAVLVAITEQSADHTVDALLIDLRSLDHSVDGYLYHRRAATHLVDALLKKSQPATHTADAALKAFDLPATHTADGLLFAQQALASTVDALLQAAGGQVHQTDGLLRATIALVHGASGWLKSLDNELTHDLDALLIAGITQTHTVDAVIGGPTLAHSVDALLRIARQAQHSTNALLVGPTLTHGTDGLLVSAIATTHDTDALLRSLNAIAHTADALLIGALGRSHLVDGLLRAEQSTSHETDALLVMVSTLTHDVDGLLRAEQAAAHSTDALLHAVDQPATHTTDALLRALGQLQHTTDTYLRSSPAVTHTADALLKDATIVMHRTNAYLTLPPGPAMCYRMVMEPTFAAEASTEATISGTAAAEPTITGELSTEICGGGCD